MTRKVFDFPDLSAVDCVRALNGHYAGPAYAFFEQVGDQGTSANRWADAIAMGIWQSRGLLFHGFEIKVSRKDWLHELKHPAKSEPVQRFCDHWWIVAPRGMIELSELPPTWGLIEIDKGKKCHHTVKAPKLEAEPLTRHFIAAVLRRHHEKFDRILVREKAIAREDGAMNGAGALGSRLTAAENTRDNLQKRIEDFEEKTGVDIAGWAHGNIAEAVQAVIIHKHRRDLVQTLSLEAETYERRVKEIRETLATLQSTPILEKAAE